MSNVIPSSNNRTGTLKDLLLPAPAQAILYLFISPFLLALYNVQHIWHKLNAGLMLSRQKAQPGSGTQISNTLWDTLSEGRLPQIVFWLVVGIFVYIAVWFIRNIVNDIRNDLIADDYVHPKTFSRRRYWESVLARKIFFACLAVILLVYIVTFLKLTDLMADLSYTAVKDYSSHSLVVLTSTLISGALMIHVLTVLARVTANSWRAIYRDL